MSGLKPYQESRKYKAWISELKKNQIDPGEIVPLKNVWTKEGNLLFSFIQTSAKDAQGLSLLPLVFLRGHFVSVITILNDLETGEEFMLLVKQRRVATGAYFYEHPAGMMDEESDLLRTAEKELEEETGLQVDRSQIHPLSKEVIYSSPGLMDEGGLFFWTELKLTSKEIIALDSRECGDPEEGEHIITVVVKPEESFKLIKNAQGLLANHMWYQMKGRPLPPLTS